METINKDKKKLKQEIENLKFFAKTLTYEHQQNVRNDILSKVRILQKQYNKLK